MSPHLPVSSPAAATRLEAILARHPTSGWQRLARILMIWLVALGTWAGVVELDQVAIAPGEVVPEGRVKLIQHLEGGIVRDILVHEGDVVSAGTPLVQLELPVSAINRNELQARLDGLRLTRARLAAETEQTPLAFPPEDAARLPAVVEAERRSFETRRQEHASTLTVLRRQEEQRQHEIDELKTKERVTQANLKFARERLAMSTQLLKDKLTARMEHVQIESDVQMLEGQLEVLAASLPRAESALAEVRARTEEESARFRRSAHSDRASVEQEIARAHEALQQATDQQHRALILSPNDGVVKNLRHNTLGGVVKPGEPILEVVPVGDKLLIEARLSPADRGYVRVGQAATVKVTAYDFTRYGGLDGRVTVVAADSTLGADNQPWFRLLVETDRAYLGARDGELPITPGMQATVEVHTDTRTVLGYFLKPLLKMRAEAFREP